MGCLILAHLVGKSKPIPCGGPGRKWLGEEGTGVSNLPFRSESSRRWVLIEQKLFPSLPPCIITGQSQSRLCLFYYCSLLQGSLPRTHSRGQEARAGFSLNELRGQELLKGRHRTSEAGVSFSKLSWLPRLR